MIALLAYARTGNIPMSNPCKKGATLVWHVLYRPTHGCIGLVGHKVGAWIRPRGCFEIIPQYLAVLWGEVAGTALAFLDVF